ncbi:MAG: SagB/ThcOx family dehydrogenase [Halodesulfurarchaeum sp.]
MASSSAGGNASIDLPDPPREGTVSVTRAIATRRSRRSFEDATLDLETVAHLLWATNGITDPDAGYRAAPSAGATYPLEVRLTVRPGGVDGLEAGVYRYRPERHRIDVRGRESVQRALREAALDQAWVEKAPITVVLSARDERTRREYGKRGIRRYVPMEAGHAGQNLYLQVEAVGLGTVAVGAFDDDAVSSLLGLDGDERPLYLYPIGRPRSRA